MGILFGIGLETYLVISCQNNWVAFLKCPGSLCKAALKGSLYDGENFKPRKHSGSGRILFATFLPNLK
jgi:hypothetical protein